MRITYGELRRIIREVIEETNTIDEIGGPKGKLRQVRGSGGRKVKLGKIEDENRELSAAEAETEFPESVDAWAEIVPHLFPEFPFDDPRSIIRGSAFFKIGPELRVAFKSHPQHELMKWSPERMDWFDIDEEV